MDKTNPSAGQPPATGGDSLAGESGVDQPVGSFGPDGGTGDDMTVRFNCRLTIRNGATLFAGPKVPGAELGSGDNQNNDVVVELQGSATFNGAGTLFGGADTGGPRLGQPDTGGGGAQQSQSHTARRGRGGSKGG